MVRQQRHGRLAQQVVPTERLRFALDPRSAVLMVPSRNSLDSGRSYGVHFVTDDRDLTVEPFRAQRTGSGQTRQ